MAVVVLCLVVGTVKAQETVKIGRQRITATNGKMAMTPEALWAMGRISSYVASPDGKRIVYQVGYYSVKENKSHQVLYVIDANGSGQQLLTSSSKNETDPA